MKTENKDKTHRVLSIYQQLMNGRLVNKSELAARYNVDERSIQRDITEIREFLDNSPDDTGIRHEVIYDRINKGYRISVTENQNFSSAEILAVCKILLDSRAFTRTEMENMISKFLNMCAPAENRKFVKELIANEAFHYIEPRHRTVFINTMWDIGTAIKEHRYIEMNYHKRKNDEIVSRKIQPLSIMFSEYYFYLIGIVQNDDVKKHIESINGSFLTIYRIDRIQEYTVLNEKFHVPYSNRFEEGEFRKRVQFMQGGTLRKVRFLYKGNNLDAVLDRLPTAEVLDEDNGIYTISAEVYGNGIDMWLRSVLRQSSRLIQQILLEKV